MAAVSVLGVHGIIDNNGVAVLCIGVLFSAVLVSAHLNKR